MTQRRPLVLAAAGAPDLGDGGRHVPGAVLIPLAEGARMADLATPVIAAGAARDLLGPGLGDLLHAARRGTPIACVIAGAGDSFAAPLAQAAGATIAPDVDQALEQPGFTVVTLDEGDAFESLMIGQAPLFTTISTIAWDDWERIIYSDYGEEEEDEPDNRGARS